MSASAPLDRQVHLQEVATFARHLLAALREAGTPEPQLADLLDDGLEIECLQCGIRLTGGDLLDLAGSADAAPEGNPKAARLRQGYCARNGCQSYYYGFTFLPRPGLDWASVIQCADRLKTEQNRAETAAIQSAKAATGSARWRLGVRIAAGAGVVLVLLLVRHWFLGGAVPFLREPKKFEIDPASLDPVTITNRPGVSPGAPLAVDAESI